MTLHILTSALTYTTHLHAFSDAENEEVRALLDHVNESSTTTSGDTPQASAPVDTAHTTLTHNGLGAHAEDDAAVAMEGEIMSQGEEGEQRRMAGGDAGQHNTGASKEMTQEGPVNTLAAEETRIPSVSTNDTLANNLANNRSGARAEDDAAVTMEGEIMSQGGDGEQSRMAVGGAGQHTTGASETPGAMSSGGLDTWTRARKSFKLRTPEMPRYKDGHGRTKVQGSTQTSGTPAAAATQPTPESAGCKRPTQDWP